MAPVVGELFITVDAGVIPIAGGVIFTLQNFSAGSGLLDLGHLVWPMAQV